jgi:hypothetical protein
MVLEVGAMYKRPILASGWPCLIDFECMGAVKEGGLKIFG